MFYFTANIKIVTKDNGGANAVLVLIAGQSMNFMKW